MITGTSERSSPILHRNIYSIPRSYLVRKTITSSRSIVTIPRCYFANEILLFTFRTHQPSHQSLPASIGQRSARQPPTPGSQPQQCPAQWCAPGAVLCRRGKPPRLQPLEPPRERPPRPPKCKHSRPRPRRRPQNYDLCQRRRRQPCFQHLQ